jgi:hypothetical protein
MRRLRATHRRVREKRRDHLREKKYREREDYRDHACLVYAKRKVRRDAAHHFHTANAARIGDRYRALCFGDEYDAGDDGSACDEKSEIRRNLRRVKRKRELRNAFGMRETIPAKMMSETPLPTPNSVMSSPIHMTSIEPAAMMMTLVMSANRRAVDDSLLTQSKRKPNAWMNASGTAR